MKIRCLLDNLILHAEMHLTERALMVFDGEESFALEAVEALFYEVVSATLDEVVQLELAHYRLLRQAEDFENTAA